MHISIYIYLSVLILIRVIWLILQSHENKNTVSSLKVKLRARSSANSQWGEWLKHPWLFSPMEILSVLQAIHCKDESRLTLWDPRFAQSRNYLWSNRLSLFSGLWDPWSSDPLAPLFSLFHTNWHKLSHKEDGLNVSLGCKTLGVWP